MKNRILQLLNENAGAAKARTGPIISAKGKEATAFLYGPIVGTQVEAEWYGGVAAETFVKELANTNADVLHLRINSPGGDVFAGVAMAEAVRGFSGKVVAHIDGLAASAATMPAIAAGETLMADGAFFMIHRAWAFFMGNAVEMMDFAATLEKVDGTLAAQYAKRTGESEGEMLAAMDAETWYTADESVAIGLATGKASDDAADEGADKKNARASAWNLSAYLKAPAALLLPAGDGGQPAGGGDTAKNDAPGPEYAPDERRERILQRARIAQVLTF